MSSEKQIEEIILIVKGAVADNAEINFEEDRILLDGNDLDHTAEQTAEALYNAGYRKTSEVAREIFEEIDKCTIRKVIRDGKIVFDSTEQFAELKKKYTEGGG